MTQHLRGEAATYLVNKRSIHLGVEEGSGIAPTTSNMNELTRKGQDDATVSRKNFKCNIT